MPDHELLRVVGRGSYGEVWLARNVMGVLRAVKVVRRSRFDRDRPYEREFQGIRRYEPLSRSSEGLVQVLHVGRGEAEDGPFFFYVMELADDAGGEGAGDAGGYVPRTLRLDLERMGRLPVEECMELGRSLAGGLSELHRHGLVHRDLKPSNVIYVNGRARLADIGLVAAQGETRSFVGTEGFVPPEGPGRPAADLFGLGRVLYQASTGLEPERFPEIPPDWLESASAPALMDFHEVVLRLGEGDLRRRYGAASEVLADLALMRSGQSLRALRVLQRRAVWLRGVATLALAGLLIACASGLWAWREHANVVRVTRAEQESRRQWVHALIARARAERLAAGLGHRDAVLSVLAEAAGLGPDGVQRREMRDEAAAVLAQTGTRWVPAPEGARSRDPMSVAFDRGQERYLRHDGAGSLVVREVGSGAEHGRWGELRPVDDEVVGFDPSGKHVLLRRGGEYMTVAVDSGRYIRTNGPCAFGGVGELWEAASGGGVRCVLLVDGRVRRELLGPRVEAGGGIPEAEGPAVVAVGPRGTRVALAAGSGLVLWDAVSGDVVETLRVPGESSGTVRVTAVAWGPGDDRLAVGTEDGRVILWELPDSEGHWVFPAHATAVRRLAFHPGGRLVAVASEGEALKVLDVANGREAAGFPAIAWQLAFRPGDGRLGLIWRGGEPGFIELQPPVGFRRFRRARVSMNEGALAFSRDGRRLAAGSGTGLEIWDPEGGRLVGWVSASDIRVVFPGVGESEWRWLDQGGFASVRLSEPVSAETRAGGLLGVVEREADGGWKHAAVSVSGGVRLAASGEESGVSLWRGDGRVAGVDFGAAVRYVAVSPGGEYAAAGALSVPGVGLWDLRTGRSAGRIESGADVRPAFSPDGRWLATAGMACSLWAMPAGTPGPSLPRVPANTAGGAVAFSPGGDRLAAVYGDCQIRVFRMPGGDPDLRLEVPGGARVVSVAFSPQGERLAASTVEGDVLLWDLALLEEALSGIGLGAGR